MVTLRGSGGAFAAIAVATVCASSWIDINIAFVDEVVGDIAGATDVVFGVLCVQGVLAALLPPLVSPVHGLDCAKA